mgnify:CR=1 FL=1
MSSEWLANIMEHCKQMKAGEFTRMVAHLLEVCGVHRTEIGGDKNADRIDLKIFFDEDVLVPAEIKSQTEMTKIQPKAVRQAAENQVLLPRIATFSDKKFDIGKASLVIGWEIPPDRSDMLNMIERLKDHYGIKVCVIPFKVLAEMAYNSSEGICEIDWNALLDHSGFWGVEE